MLRAIATSLRNVCAARAHVGRFGADEFAVVLTSSKADAIPMAESSIRQAAEGLVLPEAPDWRCPVRIGIAEAGDGDRSLREWMEPAARARYGAKHGGHHRIICAHDLRLMTPAAQAGSDLNRFEQT